MFIAILLLSMFILLLYYYYVHYGRNGRLFNLIPGPPSHPIVGNAIEFNVSAEGQWKMYISLSDKYYPIFKLWSCFMYFVLIRHPDDMEIILSSTKHIEKGYAYKLIHPWLCTGLLTSTGTKWHARRKILTPAFHFNILKQFTDILIKEGDYMAESLKDVGGTVVKDLIPFITEHTLNAICETAMGISLQKYGEVQQQYRNAIHDIIQLIVYRYNLLNIKKKRLAMLDLLIAVSRDNLLSDSDIREEVDTFMFEGHDTTAMGITFALLLLAEHKDIQERVRIEVENAMQESEGKLTMRSLQNLSYLERCLKEALRLYPSVPVISRNVEEDVKLHSYVIPAGTMLVLNIYGVHRDPNFWSNPEVFDPDRFLPERIQKRHPYSYLPFSAGPRNCIGQRFGLLELKAMIAPLIHNFYLEPIDHLKDIRLTADIIIRPSHPVHIKFIPIIRK
ncbi:hypothetical protein ACFW04_012265 [Cataglyphis niger]